MVTKLEGSYNEIKRNFREGRYEPSELNGGKFCEAIYRILEWHTSPTKRYTPFGTSIRDFGKSLKRFEGLTRFPDSVRFHIPKILDVLYGIRNRRGVGHLGGDVDPNYMDAVLVVSASDWVMAELVRIFHGLNTEQAEVLVRDLVTKRLPIVWDLGSIKRVLAPNLDFKTKVLILLYHEDPKQVKESDLVNWVEHSNSTVFRRDILLPSHKDRLIEYDEIQRMVAISPLGRKFVEENVDLEI
jgi:hypothetical protein